MLRADSQNKDKILRRRIDEQDDKALAQRERQERVGAHLRSKAAAFAPLYLNSARFFVRALRAWAGNSKNALFCSCSCRVSFVPENIERAKMPTNSGCSRRLKFRYFE